MSHKIQEKNRFLAGQGCAKLGSKVTIIPYKNPTTTLRPERNMGAHSLTRYVKTEKTLNEAWKELFENEVLENGNGPYSGSFATCKGVVDLGGPVSLVEAEKAAENMFQGIALPEKLRGFVKPMALEKWGRAGAISVLSQQREPGFRERKRLSRPIK